MREEDDLRAALRTLERHTPDPAAMLAAVRASGAAAPPRRSRRRWRRAADAPGSWSGWIAPLAAAVAVVAVVATSILVAKVYAPGRAAGGRPHRVSTTAPPFPTWNGLPAYFLATAGMLNRNTPGTAQFNKLIPPPLRAHDTVGIIATATGRVAATVRLPGYVSAITASAGAFFAAVVRNHAATFYEIRLAAGGTGASATQLPIPPVATPVGGIAASPDGRKLAISVDVWQGRTGSLQGIIEAATATGATRKWIPPAHYRTQGDIGAMSWLADGKTLAFTWYASTAASPATALRLLDTAVGGDNLLGGRAVLPLTNHESYFNGYTISPDGKALAGIVLCLTGGCRPGSPGTFGARRPTVGSVVQFATATGTPTVRYAEPELPGVTGRLQDSGCNAPLWLSNSASRMLLLCFQYRPATPTRTGVIEAHVLVLAGTQVTQLPWLTAMVNEVTAFPGVTAWNSVPSFPWNP